MMTAVSKHPNRLMTPAEAAIFHVPFAFFFILAGYVYADLIYDSFTFDFSSAGEGSTVYIFLNNLIVFSLVCILPFINFILYAVQFISLGITIFQIQSLEPAQQLGILYRHCIFEVSALILSVYVSYVIYRMLRDYLHDRMPLGHSRLRRIWRSCLVIVLLTLCGALLEGSWNG